MKRTSGARTVCTATSDTQLEIKMVQHIGCNQCSFVAFFISRDAKTQRGRSSSRVLAARYFILFGFFVSSFFLFPFFLVCHFLFFSVDISAATMFNHQRLAWRRCLLLHLFYASVCSVTLRSGHARSTRKNLEDVHGCCEASQW